MGDFFERHRGRCGGEKPEAAFAGLGPKELREAAAGPALQQAVRKCALKPSVVFREIVSFIKGSSAALDAAGGRLSRDEYLALGRKMAPTFDRSDGDDAADGGRAEVWEYFLRYEAWKAAYGAYDVMDAAAAIFAVIRDVGYPGPRIDEVYVDEVQDFTQAELRLFLACCADPNAVFLTGDTCQTIARGVGFRFDDITTMFFHLREAQAARLKAEGRTLAEGDCVQVPEVNKLSTNYRTHNGIPGASPSSSPPPRPLPRVGRRARQGPRLTARARCSRARRPTTSRSSSSLDPSHSQIEFGAHQAPSVAGVEGAAARRLRQRARVDDLRGEGAGVRRRLHLRLLRGLRRRAHVARRHRLRRQRPPRRRAAAAAHDRRGGGVGGADWRAAGGGIRPPAPRR